jgi:hypothetical protein
MFAIIDNGQEWAERIAELAILPDKRLNKRLQLILASFDSNPCGNIAQTFGEWAKAKGAYRFFSNTRVTMDMLVQPLADVTAEFCSGHDDIYVAHDTTSLNYTWNERLDNVGPINDDENLRGLHAHSSMAMTADGTPVGLLGLQSWARPIGEKVAKDRKQRPFEEKESFRWAVGIQDCYQAIERNVEPPARPRVIHLLDREGDIYEVFETIEDCHAYGIIRSSQNRRTADGHLSQDAVAGSPIRLRRILDLARGHGQPARQAKVEVRYRALQLNSNRPGRRPIQCTMIEVREVDAPEGVEPIHWFLWTNLPVHNVNDAWEIVQKYRFRWRIEEMHLVLKSGCAMEKLGLEKGERLQKALALYAAVAVRIVRLRDLARTEPDAPCTHALSGDEWRALWAHIHKQPVPEDCPVPTLREAIRWIGRLGGHLGRRCDGEPGVRRLWCGYRKLQLLTVGYQAGEAQTCHSNSRAHRRVHADDHAQACQS